MSKKKSIPLSVEKQEMQNTALADLLIAKGFTAQEETTTPPRPGDAGIDLAKMGKIVVRRERKGHGGKTVTLVSGITLPAPRLEELARDMRKGLGCGSQVEHGVIVLQGDIPDRARDWLAKHGATKIVLGN